MYQEYYGSSNDGNDGENIKFSYFYQCIQQFINTNIIASINTLDEAQENSPSILQHFIALIKIYDDENIKSDENIEMDYSRFTFGLTDEAKKLDDATGKYYDKTDVFGRGNETVNKITMHYTQADAVVSLNVLMQIQKISAYKKIQKICNKLSPSTNFIQTFMKKFMYFIVSTRDHSSLKRNMNNETIFENTIIIFQNIILPLIKAQHLLIFQIFNAFFITLSQVCLTLSQFAKIKYSNMKLFKQIVDQIKSEVTRGWSERSSVLYSNIIPTDANIKKSQEIFKKVVNQYSDKWDIQQGFTVNHSEQTQKRYNMLQSGMLIAYIQQSPYNVNWLVNELNTNEKYKQYFKESKITVNDVYNIKYTDNQKQYIKSISSILSMCEHKITVHVNVKLIYTKHIKKDPHAYRTRRLAAVQVMMVQIGQFQIIN